MKKNFFLRKKMKKCCFAVLFFVTILKSKSYTIRHFFKCCINAVLCCFFCLTKNLFIY